MARNSRTESVSTDELFLPESRVSSERAECAEKVTPSRETFSEVSEKVTRESFRHFQVFQSFHESVGSFSFPERQTFVQAKFGADSRSVEKASKQTTVPVVASGRLVQVASSAPQ